MNAELELRLRAAKVALGRAAAACLRNEPGAAELANVALAEVASLQAQLKAQRPAPVGIWAESERIRGER